jgi:hypothetical protein
MMADEYEGYELGNDVSAEAKASTRRSTAVLSVRFSADELAEIEQVSLGSGKTVSQVVREAVTAFLHHKRFEQPTVTISIREQSTFSVGTPRQSSAGVSGTLALAGSAG